LRASGYLAKEEIGVRIEIDLPGTSVLLSDFNLWHCVLNYSYLAFNEQEDDKFVHELDEAGVSQMRPYPEPFNHRVLLSWQRIFDLEAGDVERSGIPRVCSEQAPQSRTPFCHCEVDGVNRSNLIPGSGLPRTFQVLAMTERR